MNPGQPPAIEFRNVSISFDGAPALQNVSFTLPRGEMLCITGDSDSGKSILLRLALGFLRPDEGEILINGRETTAMEENDLLALRRATNAAFCNHPRFDPFRFIWIRFDNVVGLISILNAISRMRRLTRRPSLVKTWAYDPLSSIPRNATGPSAVFLR
jgi:ABC-type transporter Mla maintaining outer membrane lipid asymmetry ATPase subunit MlaF